MTLSELKENIAKSPHKEWYNTFQLELNFPTIDYKLTFTGLSTLYEYILNQIDGYEKLSNLPHEFEAVKKRFKDAKSTTLTLFKNNDVNNQSWISNLSFFSTSNPILYPYNLPVTEFLLGLKKQNVIHYNSAYEYFNGSINNIASKQYFIGYMLAYEFSNSINSKVVLRSEAEAKSLEKIRNEYQTKIIDAEKELVDYISQAHQKFIESSTAIDFLSKEKEEELTTLYKKIEKEHNEFKTKSASEITKLEKLYQEKLKLEAPATYWRLRAKQLRFEGYWWLGALVVCVAITVGILISFLNGLSTNEFESIFDNTAKSVKWSVALVTIISFLAFAIRTFSKLTFSSFHLVRDAEEREQLTYVYLALQKEAKIDPTERHLIMQSLFSRADTGLLKDDASPTMPGNIVDQAFRKQ